MIQLSGPAERLVEILGTKTIEAVDGFPASPEARAEIARELSQRLLDYEPSQGEEVHDE